MVYAKHMAIDPESLYFQLRQLVFEAPILIPGSVTPDVQRWLGRAALFVEQANPQSSFEPILFRSAADQLGSERFRDSPHQILNIVHRALARAEAAAPVSARGGFIAKGAALDALQVVGQVLAEALTDVLIIDPYMNTIVFTDFARLAKNGVTVRLLSDREYTQPDALMPPMERWVAQYGHSKPLEVRQTRRKALHDRDIVIDEAKVWHMTQSLKDFASRSHAGVGRVEAEQAKMKVEAYRQLWLEAKPVICSAKD